jgi:hypothetical protein
MADVPSSARALVFGLTRGDPCPADLRHLQGGLSVSWPQSLPGVDLFWLPLGAGGRSVRLNGRVFEAVASRLQHRPVCDLYHSALEVRVPIE